MPMSLSRWFRLSYTMDGNAEDTDVVPSIMILMYALENGRHQQTDVTTAQVIFQSNLLTNIIDVANKNMMWMELPYTVVEEFINLCKSVLHKIVNNTGKRKR